MEHINLDSIENDHEITRKTDSKFLYEYQNAILLALVESGRLSEVQYNFAVEKLRKQK